VRPSKSKIPPGITAARMSANIRSRSAALANCVKITAMTAKASIGHCHSVTSTSSVVSRTSRASANACAFNREIGERRTIWTVIDPNSPAPADDQSASCRSPRPFVDVEPIEQGVFWS